MWIKGHYQASEKLAYRMGENIIGCRHFDVAKKLKELKKEELFTLTLIEPKKAFKKRNPAPPTRTLTQASLTKKP